MLWPEGLGPVFRNRQVRVKVEQRGKITPYGGLALAHDLAMRLGLDRDINRSIPLLKINLPHFESDHVLTHVYNLYVGGHCIEDIANLQHSAAVEHLLGACRIPDASTAGDFLRRFHQPYLEAFQAAIDRAREKVWCRMPRRAGLPAKPPWGPMKSLEPRLRQPRATRTGFRWRLTSQFRPARKSMPAAGVASRRLHRPASPYGSQEKYATEGR